MGIFHDRLIGLAEENNLTKVALAEILGVTPNTILNWAKDIEPKSSVIVKAADYFKVSADYLLGRTNKRDYEETTQPLSPKELEVIHYLTGRFSNEQLDSIMKVVKGMERFELSSNDVPEE